MMMLKVYIYKRKDFNSRVLNVFRKEKIRHITHSESGVHNDITTRRDKKYMLMYRNLSLEEIYKI